MLGNGLANIIAALIVAGAIVGTGGFGDRRGDDATALTEEEIAKLYARAVGDIRNDIVVNCGCCGEDGARRAGRDPF